MADTETRSERIRLALEEIRRKNGGRLTPALVVAAAKNPKHTLHDEFEWDDRKAAARQREDVARSLIRYVTVTVTTERRAFKSVVYVRDQELPKKEAGYVAITNEDIEYEHAERIVLAELGRCEAAVERARGICAVLDRHHPGLSDRLELMLQEIVGLRQQLSEPARRPRPRADSSIEDQPSV